MEIFCTVCKKDMPARLASDMEIYGRSYGKTVYICECGAYVGTHKGTDNPLGVMSGHEMRNAKIHIHALIDPLWKSKKIKRGKLYKMLSDRLGYEYHTGDIRTIEEARRVYKVARRVIKEIS